MISILQGNAVDVMKNDIKSRSIDIIFTSPTPIYHLQSNYNPDKRVLGTEITEKDYLNNLVSVFDTAARTVLKKSGSVWVQMGDYHEKRSLRLIPEKFMIRMKSHGWNIRGIVIWHRTENIHPKRDDRLKNDWEYLIWFVRKPALDYYFNSSSKFIASSVYDAPMILNLGNEFASGFPHKLIEIAIDATCPIGGNVLDMFAGTGETAVVAKKMNRNTTLIDIDEKMYYALQARFKTSV